MSAAILSLRGLTVGYRAQGTSAAFTLGGIDAEVAAGRMVCLLGPNGSGKSTLLRTIAGFQAPLAGSVLYEGRPSGELSENERARFVGVVLTERVDSGLLDGRELVSLGRYPYTAWTGTLSKKDREVVDWALATVGAERFAPRPVMSLSDGERQKIMVARALAQQPRLILLDEPTAYLDLPRKVEVMTLLLDLARETGCSVLLSTHELEIAQTLADRLWLIRSDQPEAVAATGGLHDGSPEDLILSGELEQVFAASGVRFDRSSGRFLFGRSPHRRALLHGSGLGRRWTERALNRVGIAAVVPATVEAPDHGLPVVSVTEHDGDFSWTVSSGGVVRECRSLSALLDLLEA